MKPNLPVICNYYGIRKPKFHLPVIRHVFAEPISYYDIEHVFDIEHNLIRIINDDIESVGIMDVV